MSADVPSPPPAEPQPPRSQFWRSEAQAHVVSTNERAVLDIVRRRGAVSRADLTRATGLTAQSTMRLVDELVARGLLRLGDRLPREGRGKPSPAVELVPDYAYSLGVSITTDSVQTVLVDFAGSVLASRHDAAPALDLPAMDLPALVMLLRGHLRSLLRAHRIDAERLFGIGVGITGFFVGDGRRVNPPLPLEALALIDLEGALAEALGHPVWLDNDGSIAAAGESLLGVGQWAPSFVYLYFAHGLGGGVVIDGRCVRGAHGNAGEVAGMLPALGLERPTLEQLRRMLADDGLSFADIHAMLEAFNPHWPACERWVAAAVPAMSLIVSAAAASLDPDAIVFGGRLPRVLAERLIAQIRIDNLPRRGRRRPEPRLVSAEAPGDATAIGAAVLPFKEWLFG